MPCHERGTGAEFPASGNTNQALQAIQCGEKNAPERTAPPACFPFGLNFGTMKKSGTRPWESGFSPDWIPNFGRCSVEHQVFISYHHDSSAQLVEHIVQALESCGIKCWYAPRDVDSKYAGDIVRAIEECRIFLLIMNRYATHSEHVLNEIDCAFNLFHQKTGIRLVPFRTDKENLPDDVRYYLGRIHSLDGSEPPEEARISDLVSRITYCLQGQEEGGSSRGQAAGPAPGAAGIRSTALVHNTNFVGREEELAEMHRLLQGENNKLFLFGTGGMGKSELARQYLRRFQGAYTTMVWMTYNADLQEMLITDQFLLIHGLENEKQNLTTPQAREAYYEKKLNYLKEHCGRDTLLVVDNLDAQDSRLPQLLEGRYSMILTSRISREKEGYQELAIHSLDRWEDQLALFKKFYKRPLGPEEEPALMEVFRRMGFHTYGIQLLARQMQASRLSPSAMLDYLHGSAGTVQRRPQMVMEHVLEVMGQIFDLSRLPPEKISILKNMALLPVEGVETELFFELTGLEDYMLLDELIDGSFIQYNCISDMISLHPLLVDTIAGKFPGFARDCQVYLDNLTQRLSRFTHCKYQEKQVLLSLGETYYLKWCDPPLPFQVPLMERLAEAYAEYFMRDKSIGVMERLIALHPDPLRESWYHYYIANQRRCLEQYELLSQEAARSLELIQTVPQSPERDRQLSQSYSMMGWARYYENRLEESGHYFQQALRLRREILPDDSPLIAWAYYNRAAVLMKMGRLEEAAQGYKEAIRRFEAIDEIGICVPAYLSAAESYLELGDLKEAEQALSQAFTYEYEYYGAENCRSYWLYQVKARLLARQGNEEEARKFHQMSKEAYQSYLDGQG